jgi:hypothetical protein
MACWEEFAQRAPELAAFRKARFQGGVVYLGTLRADGSPRVHPVTSIIGEQLFLFMEPTSPKARTCSAMPATHRIVRLKIQAAVAVSLASGGVQY